MIGKVIQIGISKDFKGIIHSVNEVQAITGKGLVSDRHFKKNNNCKIFTIDPSKRSSILNKKYGIDFSKQSYTAPGKRKWKVHGYVYQPQYSDAKYAIYKNKNGIEIGFPEWMGLIFKTISN